MVTNCWVPHCRSRWYKYCEIKFHTFPVDKKMRRMWASRIVADRLPSESSKVCSLHFCKSDYEPNSASDRVRLKKTAVPSRNLDSKTAAQFKPDMRRPSGIAANNSLVVEQQTEQTTPHQKPLSFKMKIRKNPAAVNSNGVWKTDKEFTVPVNPYYLYDENYDSSTPVASSSYTNPYSDDNSLLQESAIQSDDNSLPDHQQSSINEHQFDYDTPPRQPAVTPQPQKSSTRNLRKRRRPIPTADDSRPTRSSPTPPNHQRAPPLPLSAPTTPPPKLQIAPKRNTALTKPCEAELVDGFCNYLAMQLKRLSAQLFLDVQMDVQQIVLQAQRSALDVSIDNNDNELVERNENGASLLSNARLTNGFGEQMVQQNSHMDESVVCRKGGDDEVEWEECQIKSEPLDEEEEEEVYADEEPTLPVVDLEAARPLPATTLAMPKAVHIPSVESTVLPKITTVDSTNPVQPTKPTSVDRQCFSPTPSNGEIQMEADPSDTIHNQLDDEPMESGESFNQPEAAFLMSTDDRCKNHPDDDANGNIAYTDIACAMSGLSGAVGTLTTALNGLNPYITNSTKTI